MDGGNKMTLLIRLLGECTLEIEFMHWDKRFLSDYNDEKNVKFVYFETKDLNFCMYSHEEGYILDDGQFTLVVPDIDHYKPGFVLRHEFISDIMRKRFLKIMYDHIEEWGDTWHTFKNDKQAEHNIIVHNQFWVY